MLPSLKSQQPLTRAHEAQKYFALLSMGGKRLGRPSTLLKSTGTVHVVVVGRGPGVVCGFIQHGLCSSKKVVYSKITV